MRRRWSPSSHTPDRPVNSRHRERGSGRSQAREWQTSRPQTATWPAVTTKTSTMAPRSTRSRPTLFGKPFASALLSEHPGWHSCWAIYRAGAAPRDRAIDMRKRRPWRSRRAYLQGTMRASRFSPETTRNVEATFRRILERRHPGFDFVAVGPGERGDLLEALAPAREAIGQAAALDQVDPFADRALPAAA